MTSTLAPAAYDGAETPTPAYPARWRAASAGRGAVPLSQPRCPPAPPPAPIPSPATEPPAGSARRCSRPVAARSYPDTAVRGAWGRRAPPPRPPRPRGGPGARAGVGVCGGDAAAPAVWREPRAVGPPRPLRVRAAIHTLCSHASHSLFTLFCPQARIDTTIAKMFMESKSEALQAPAILGSRR